MPESLSDEDEDRYDDFKTPRTIKTPRATFITPSFGTKAPFSQHVMRSSLLKSKADETVIRFVNKYTRFGKQLDIIEDYIADGLRTRAQCAAKDVVQLRNSLEEDIMEVKFMIGDAAKQYEEQLDFCLMRYRQILEEVGPRERYSTEQTGTLKLKPIEIPKFAGSFQQWPTFSGLFQTMVIEC